MKDGKLKVEPMTIDALSWPMTLVNTIGIVNLADEKAKFVETLLG